MDSPARRFLSAYCSIEHYRVLLLWVVEHGKRNVRQTERQTRYSTQCLPVCLSVCLTDCFPMATYTHTNKCKVLFLAVLFTSLVFSYRKRAYSVQWTAKYCLPLAASGTPSAASNYKLRIRFVFPYGTPVAHRLFFYSLLLLLLLRIDRACFDKFLWDDRLRRLLNLSLAHKKLVSHITHAPRWLPGFKWALLEFEINRFQCLRMLWQIFKKFLMARPGNF